MVAAFLVTGLVDGIAGLRELWSCMIRWQVPLRWHLAAAAPLGLALGAAAVVSLGPGGFPGGLPGGGFLGALAPPDLFLDTGYRGFNPVLLPGFSLVVTGRWRRGAAAALGHTGRPSQGSAA